MKIGKGTPTQFHATISKDWTQDDPNSYDPDYLWEGNFPSPEAAIAALQRALSDTSAEVPWTLGYLVSVVHLGPRGGIYRVTLERTQDHPSLAAALAALAARQ